MIEQGYSLSSATIGVLTALPHEFAAACYVLGCNQEVSVDGRIYKIGAVRRRDNKGSHIVVVGRILQMGTVPAATRTVLLQMDCPNVEEFIMCGIAGAIPRPSNPSNHVRLGDIVVTSGDGIVQYDFIRESERRTETRPRYYTPSQRLLEVAALLQAEEGVGMRPWDRHIAQAISELSMKGQQWGRPASDMDRLCEFSGARPTDYLVRIARKVGVPSKRLPYKPIKHPHDPERLDGLPRIFFGVIASANNLQKNSARRDELGSQFNAMAVEMEGIGVADAARQLEKKFFVVRGTCDYCNSDKNNDWQHYAAIIAAAYTKSLLEAAHVLTYLGKQGPGPVPTKTESGGIQSLITAVESADQKEKAEVKPSRTVGSAVQRDLEHALLGVLEDQARTRISEIKGALDEWEFQSAITAGNDLSMWVAEHTEQLPDELLVEVYELLARIEIVKADRNRGEVGTLNLSRAEEFLAKAKNVAGR